MRTLRRFIIAILIVYLFTFIAPASSWVGGYRPFEDGEATVVLQPHCLAGDCRGILTNVDWADEIDRAVAEWESVGSSFLFHREEEETYSDPCDAEYGTIVFILTDSRNICPGDGPSFFSPGRAEYDFNKARIYLNIGSHIVQDGRAYRIILHELGHALGLGHPDEVGQRVQAVMNSVVVHEELQEDDIEGLLSLYPPQPLKGFLGNPAPGDHVSGIGVISGWTCKAKEVVIEFSGHRGHTPYREEWKAGYGTRRTDTFDACGDVDNGFSLLFNWYHLGEGVHTVRALVDGRVLGEAEVSVTTLGEEFVREKSGQWTLQDFPEDGESITVRWSETLQNLVIVDHHK